MSSTRARRGGASKKRRTLDEDEEAFIAEESMEQGDEGSEWDSDAEAGAAGSKRKAKAKKASNGKKAAAGPRQPRGRKAPAAKKAKTAKAALDEEHEPGGEEEEQEEQEEQYILEEVWEHILAGLVSTDGRLYKTCMFRTWAHVAKDIANLSLVCKAASRAVAHDQWKRLESSCLKSIPSVPEDALRSLKIDKPQEPGTSAAGQLPASNGAAQPAPASSSAAPPPPAASTSGAAASAGPNAQLTPEAMGALRMQQWMKVPPSFHRLEPNHRFKILETLLDGSGANSFKNFYLTHTSYYKQERLLHDLLLPKPLPGPSRSSGPLSGPSCSAGPPLGLPAAQPKGAVGKAPPTAVQFEIRREGCRDVSILYGLADAAQTFLLTPKEIRELPHHQEYRSNFSGTDVTLVDMWSQRDLVRRALTKRSHDALKEELAEKEKRRQENAQQRVKVKAASGTSLLAALKRRWAHLAEDSSSYNSFLGTQLRLVQKNQCKCKGKDAMRIEALVDYFTKGKGPGNVVMSQEMAMEVIERRAFLLHHDREQSYRSMLQRVRQPGVNSKSLRLSDQQQAEAAALKAFLKKQEGGLEAVLSMPQLPRHMHEAVKAAWPLRNQADPEPVRPAPRHSPHLEFVMMHAYYDDSDDFGDDF